MANVIEGNYAGKGKQFGVVVSRFNETVTRMLLDGALNELRRAGVRESDVTVVWVPGAFEIPTACAGLAKSRQPDGVVALGCIIRGETSHYEQMAQSVSDSLAQFARERLCPIGFGVLTVENMEQAVNRAGGKYGNRGRDAARSALEMANLLSALKSTQKKERALDQFLATHVQ